MKYLLLLLILANVSCAHALHGIAQGAGNAKSAYQPQWPTYNAPKTTECRPNWAGDRLICE